MTILCMTGWQQNKDELAAIAPEDAMHFDYASYGDIEKLYNDLPREPRLAIGWSLGGQLLVRAVAEGQIKPKVLVLLSAPFQCVASDQYPYGMPMAGMEEFRDNYAKDAQKTLLQFNALIGLGDSRSGRVIRALSGCSEIWGNGLFWLNELSSYSCDSVSFDDFPKTIIVHGENDKVIDVASARAFKTHLSNSQMHIWPECGHAPHLHNPDILREIIGQHV